ncbi:hypothetical protein ACP3P8_18920 [Pseudomonas aeruginosa]
MVLVTALTGFDHGGRRRRDEQFDVSPQHAAALKRNGLVTYDENQADPDLAAGESRLHRKWPQSHRRRLRNSPGVA